MTKRKQPPPSRQPVKKKKTSTHVKDWLTPANDFLNNHFKKIAGLIFILSLALSAVYYFEGRNSPLRSLHKWQNSDMSFFDSWAQHIAAGDLWCDTMLHPYHEWHDLLAIEYFHQYPEIAASYYSENFHNGSVDTLAARKALINDIYKGKAFHQEPLYTYILAADFKIFGHDYKWIYFLQFLLGALTNVLVFLIGRKYFGALIGLFAAAFVMLNGAIMVYEMVALRTTMTNFFTVLLLYLFLLVIEKPDWKIQLLFGASSGIALLGQSYLIVFLVPAMGWFVWMHRKNKKEAAFSMAAFLGAMLIIMSPLFYRNMKVGVPFASLASHGAMSYIPANTTYSAPMKSFFIDFPTMAKFCHDSKGKMIPTAFQCLGTFTGIGDFWRVYKAKINGMFMWYEMPNNMSYYMYREFAPVLGQLPVRYFFIAPLGIAGLILGWWRYRKKFIPFLLMTAACMAPLMIAGDLARYRTPLEIMLSLAAALLIIDLMYFIIRKNWKKFFIWFGLFLLSLFYTGNIVPKGFFVINLNDLGTMYASHYMDRLLQLEKEKKDEEYLQVTAEMMGYLPDYFFTTKLSDPIYFANEADCCKDAANMMDSHLKTLQLLKKKESDIDFYTRRINILRAKHAKYYSNRR